MSTLPLTAFDLLVGIVLLVSVVAALVRGFTAELLSLVSWLGAFVIGYHAFAPVRPLIAEAVGNDLLADLGTALAVFVVPFVVLRIVTAGLSRRVRESALGGLDRLFGLAYGAARGALLVSAAYLALLVVSDEAPLPGWVGRAWTRPYVERGAALLGRLLPAGFLEPGRIAGAAGAAADGFTGYSEEASRSLEELVRGVR